MKLYSLESTLKIFSAIYSLEYVYINILGAGLKQIQYIISYSYSPYASVSLYGRLDNNLGLLGLSNLLVP